MVQIKRHNKGLVATARSSLVRVSSGARPPQPRRSAGIDMTIWSVTPVGQKPARCQMGESDGDPSDPPAAVSADRIATRHTGTASRAALRLLIAGSGARSTGPGSEQFRRIWPVDSTSRDGSADRTTNSCGIPASCVFLATNEAEQVGGCDGEQLPS